MRKVVLGSAILISGVIGIIGIMISLAVKNPDSSAPLIDLRVGHTLLNQAHLSFPLWLFIALAFIGLILGIWGILEKPCRLK